MKRTISFFLSLSLLWSALGPAPALAAGALRGSVPSGWAPVVRGFALSAQTQPGLSLSAEARRMIGHANLELALAEKRGTQRLLFVQHLPASAREPGAFAKLAAQEQARLIESGLQAARALLDAEAEALEAKADSGQQLDDSELERVVELSKVSYYLSPEAALTVKALASSERAKAIERKSYSIGKVLFGGARLPSQESAAAVSAEFGSLFGGARTLVLERARSLAKAQRTPVENERFLRETLLPYAETALAESRARALERGVAAGALDRMLLEGHQYVFGRLAPPALVRAMRREGSWTPFVAALSIAAARSFARQVGGGEAARAALSEQGENHQLYIKIPAWHDAAQKARTVAEWLASEWGPADKKEEKPSGFPLFKAFGIPVRAELSFLFIVGLISYQLAMGAFPAMIKGLSGNVYLAMGLTSALGLYLSVILHEFGHALTARLFGVRTTQIVMHILGGVAQLDREPRTAWGEFLVALAGPLVSVVLAIGLGLAAPALAPVSLPLAVIVKYLAMMNMVLAVFNMLPAFPMDGGRVLRSLLWGVTRDHYTATRLAARIGWVFGWLFTALGFYNFLTTGQIGALMMVLLGSMLRAWSLQGGISAGTELEEPTKK